MFLKEIIACVMGSTFLVQFFPDVFSSSRIVQGATDQAPHAPVLLAEQRIASNSSAQQIVFHPSQFETSGMAKWTVYTDENDRIYGFSQEYPSSFLRDLNRAFGDLFTVFIQHYRVFLVLLVVLIALNACRRTFLAWPFLRLKTLIWGNIPAPEPTPAVPDVLMRQLSALPNQFKSLSKTNQNDVNHLQDSNKYISERLDSVQEDKINKTQAVEIFRGLSSDTITRVTDAEGQLKVLSSQGTTTSSKVQQLEFQVKDTNRSLSKRVGLVETELKSSTQGTVWREIMKLTHRAGNFGIAERAQNVLLGFMFRLVAAQFKGKKEVDTRVDSLAKNQKKLNADFEKLQSSLNSLQGNGDGMSRELKDELESIRGLLAALAPRVKGTEDQLELIGAGSTSAEIWKALPTLNSAFKDLWKAVKALDNKLDGFAALKAQQQEHQAALVDHQRRLKALERNAAPPAAGITKAEVERMIKESENRSRNEAEKIQQQMHEELEVQKAEHDSFRERVEDYMLQAGTHFATLQEDVADATFEKSERGQRITILEEKVKEQDKAIEAQAKALRERICPCSICSQGPAGRVHPVSAAGVAVEAPVSQPSAASSAPPAPAPATLPEAPRAESVAMPAAEATAHDVAAACSAPPPPPPVRVPEAARVQSAPTPAADAHMQDAPAAPFVPLPPSSAALPEVAVVEPAPQAPAVEDLRDVQEDSYVGDGPVGSSSGRAPMAAQARPRGIKRPVRYSQRGRHAPRTDTTEAVAAPAPRFQAPEGYAPAVFSVPIETPAFVAPAGIPSFPPATGLPLPPAAVEAAASAATAGFTAPGGTLTRGTFPPPTTPLAPLGFSRLPQLSAPPAPSTTAEASPVAATSPPNSASLLSAQQIQALQDFNNTHLAPQPAFIQPTLNPASNFRAVPINAGASYLDSQPRSASPTMPQANQFQTAEPPSIASPQLDEDRDAEGEPDYEMPDRADDDRPEQADHARAPKTTDWAAAGQQAIVDEPDEFDEPETPSQPSTSAPLTQPSILPPRATVINLTEEDIDEFFRDLTSTAQADPSDTIMGESEPVSLDPQPATQADQQTGQADLYADDDMMGTDQPDQQAGQFDSLMSDDTPAEQGPWSSAQMNVQPPQPTSQTNPMYGNLPGLGVGGWTPPHMRQQNVQPSPVGGVQGQGFSPQTPMQSMQQTAQSNSFHNAGSSTQTTVQPRYLQPDPFAAYFETVGSRQTPVQTQQQNAQYAGPSTQPTGQPQQQPSQRNIFASLPGFGSSTQTPPQPQQAAQPGPSEQAPQSYTRIVNGMVFTTSRPPAPVKSEEDIDHMAASNSNDQDLPGDPLAASTSQTGDPMNWHPPSAPLAASTDDTQDTAMGGQFDDTEAQDQPQSSTAQTQGQAAEDDDDDDDVNAGWGAVDNPLPGGSFSGAVDQMLDAAAEGLAHINRLQNQPQDTTAQTQDTGMADQFGTASGSQTGNTAPQNIPVHLPPDDEAVEFVRHVRRRRD